LSVRLRRALRLTANAGLVGVVYGVNAYTPPDVRLGILYVVPVVLVTWQDGIGAGLVFAAGTTALRYVVGLQQMPASTPLAARLVNEGGFLLVVGIAMAGLGQLRRTQHALARLASHDQLTGALGAPAFTARLSIELERARRYRRPLAVLYLDLDDFKAVNDRHGHGTGDAVLRLVGDAIKRGLRQVDEVGRLGGDEFAVLMPDTDGVVALTAAHRLAASIRSSFQGRPSVTVSIGVVASPAGGAPAEELLHQADAAMYEAKRGGKDRVVQVASG
jgi:diguanylate cyclase (GGDEF)-like protein